MGHPRSENLKVTERYHRPNSGRLIMEWRGQRVHAVPDEAVRNE